MRSLPIGWIAVLALGASLAGCGRGTAAPVPDSPAKISAGGEPASSAEDTHEKLHAGAYQLDSALDDLQQARTALNGILAEQGGDTKEALLNVLDTLDSAGETLGLYNVSPELSEVQHDPAAAEKHRLKAVEESGNAMREIREARGVVTDMLNSQPPKKEKTALEEADDAIGEGLDAISDGIKLLGGNPPPEDKGEPDPS